MGEAIAKNHDRNLWDEVRKMSKTTTSLPNMMDAKADTDEIAKIFSGKYNTLYNSVGYKSRNMSMLQKDIESRIENGCPSNAELSNHKHTITVKEVKDAVDKLKYGKKEEMDYIQTILNMVLKGCLFY